MSVTTRRSYARTSAVWCSEAGCIVVASFFFQAEDGIRDVAVTGVQTCALPISSGDAELELWAATRHAGPFERLAGKPLRIEVSGNVYAEHPHATPRVPGQAVRRRGDRRIRQDDAAGTAGEVAERRRAPRLRHRMELVRPREGGDQDRQEEKRAHPDDVQPAARDRHR